MIENLSQLVEGMPIVFGGDRVARVCRQPVGKGATGGSRSDDDKVILHRANPHRLKNETFYLDK
jgi:hypothetical protein